ncbi:MAG: thiamine pyrophosphate-binding protein, partial [Gemmatimonadota bacterium]
MRVSEALGRTLVEELGARRVFGLVGSGNFELTNAVEAAGGRFVAARHECAALCMADAHARVTGEVGVATVHQGPGLTNAATGLTEAAKARTPLLLLAADTSAAAVQSNFRIDQESLAEAVDAVPERIHSAESAVRDLARAHRRAARERRAVVLNCPLDVQGAEAPSEPEIPPETPLRPPSPDPEAVAEAAELVERSERPAIVAGRGAVRSGAREVLVELGDRIGAVLATSANGNGLFAGRPWSVGIAGGFAPPAAAELLQDADLLLAFGASLNMWTTRHGTFAGPDTRVLQVDVDPGAIGAHRPADVGVVADATRAARALLGKLEARGHRSRGFRTDEVERRIDGGG